MSEPELIVPADEIEPFTVPGDEGVYESQCLVDRYGVESKKLQVNRFTLKAGKKLHGGCHPVENDECYYVLRGRGRIEMGGDPATGDGAIVHQIGPDTAIFIPGGTFHALENPSAEDLVILTIWPTLPGPGANALYDTRVRMWGTSFKKKS